MPKLWKTYTFLDLSDYGRAPAVRIAHRLKHTSITPVHMTLAFMFVWLCGIILLLHGYYVFAGICLVIKSVLDAADGELSRVKHTPSYTGRYLDSIFDLVLNFLILYTIGYMTTQPLLFIIIAWICIQLQGTLYNYYYVILRNLTTESDTTSRVIEQWIPKALPGESQKTVNILFRIFTILYGWFDKTILYLDPSATRAKNIPHWFMTFVSLYGLWFQLLIIAGMLAWGYIEYVIPFIILYTLLLPVMIFVRNFFLSDKF